MATSLEESKIGPDRSYSNKYLSFGAKIVKIGPVVCILIKERNYGR